MPSRPLPAVILLALAGSAANAQVWNNPGAGAWDDPANWTPMSVPNGVGAPAEIISTESGGVFENPGAITSPVPITIGSLNLDMGIGGPFLNIVCPGVIFDNGGGADVFLSGDATGVASIDAPITLRGDLRSSWTGSNTTFSFPITGDYGIYHDAAFASGRLRLAGDNAFTGPIVCTRGRVSVTRPEALGTAGAGVTVIGEEAALICEVSAAQAPLTFDGEPLTLQDGGNLWMIRETTWAEDITLVNSGKITPWFDNEIATVSGKITGGTLEKESARSRFGDPLFESILFVTNTDNDYAGGTVIRSGILAIPSDAALGLPGTPITFDRFGFSEGDAVLLTTAGATIARDITMLDESSLRAGEATTATYTGVISGTGSLAIGGVYGGAAQSTGLPEWTGVVDLAGANTLTGPVIVLTGTLMVSNATGSATGTNNVAVGAEGRLAGDGAISGDVDLTAGGELAPGAPFGNLNTGAVTMGAATTTSIEIAGTSASDFSALAATGVVTIDGTLSVTLDPAYTPMLGDEFAILTAASVSGVFADEQLPDGFEITYGAAEVRLAVTSLASDCPADLDGDSAVGSGDLGVLLASWGQAGGPADLDGSGTVGSGDLGALLAAWGVCP